MAADEKSMIERVRERKERHKQRGKAYRAMWVVLGSVVILVGLALSLPGIPGPGLLLVAVGLGMLALEFDRAERLLEKVLLRLERLSNRAQRATRRHKIVAGVLVAGVIAAAIVGVLVWGVPFVPEESYR